MNCLGEAIVLIDGQSRNYAGEIDDVGNALGFGKVDRYETKALDNTNIGTSNGDTHEALSFDYYGTWKNNQVHGICRSI